MANSLVTDARKLLAIVAKGATGKLTYEHRAGGNPLNDSTWGKVGFWIKEKPIQVCGSGEGWDGDFIEPSKENQDAIIAARNAALPGGLVEKMADEITRLRLGIADAKTVFEDYAKIHRDKGLVGEQKAIANQQLAEKMEGLLK